MGSFQGPLLHVQSVVDRSVGRSCAIVSRGKLVSNQGDGKFRGLCGTHRSLIERSVVCSCASENQGKLVSNFPIGAMETLEHERTSSAVFPLMVHDEMATVPPWT